MTRAILAIATVLALGAVEFATHNGCLCWCCEGEPESACEAVSDPEGGRPHGGDETAAEGDSGGKL